MDLEYFLTDRSSVKKRVRNNKFEGAVGKKTSVTKSKPEGSRDGGDNQEQMFMPDLNAQPNVNALMGHGSCMDNRSLDSTSTHLSDSHLNLPGSSGHGATSHQNMDRLEKTLAGTNSMTSDVLNNREFLSKF